MNCKPSNSINSTQRILEKTKILALDCDGVILDSNQIKIKALEETLSPHADRSIVEHFCDFFRKNFGISRYRLFEIFISEYLNSRVSQTLYDSLLVHFGSLCREMYKTAPLTEGVLEFLENYKSTHQLYVVSAGDENELKDVFMEKNLSHYFHRIYGSPKTKLESLQIVIEESKKQPIVMIGDAMNDYLASSSAGIPFIFMKKYSTVKNEMSELAKQKQFMTINTLEDLL